MNKWQLAEYMQNLDQQAAESRRQIRSDTHSLFLAHDLFDDIAEETRQQYNSLNGIQPPKEKEKPKIIEARLIDDWDDSGKDDW